MTELAKLLPDAAPPAGARERVRAGIRDRVERSRHRRTVRYAAVVAAALVVATAAIVRAPGDRAEFVGAPLGAGAIELSSGARILVTPGSSVSLVRDDFAATVLRVDHGSVLARVAKRAPGRPFVVLADSVRVEVVGTVFAVGIGPGSGVGVRGFEGTVRVVSDAGEARVGAGEAWPAGSRGPEIARDALQAVGFEVAPEPVVTSEPPARSPPPAAEPPVAKPRSVVRATPVRPYLAARELERTGAFERALAAYRAIRGGPEAEDALYAVGRLQRGALADPDAAHATFVAYRAQFPDGRYARSVDLYFLDRALARREFAAIERETDRFLAAHAADPLAPRFLRARAAARVQRRDCAGARADLDSVPATPETRRLRESCQ